MPKGAAKGTGVEGSQGNVRGERSTGSRRSEYGVKIVTGSQRSRKSNRRVRVRVSQGSVGAQQTEEVIGSTGCQKE